MPERLPITSAMHQRMVEVARDFRKEPTASEQLLWQSLRGRRLMASSSAASSLSGRSSSISSTANTH